MSGEEITSVVLAAGCKLSMDGRGTWRDNEILGAPRVAHRVGRYVASADRRRGQLCTFTDPPAVDL